MIKLTINTTRHNDEVKRSLYEGRNGKYLSLVLWENRDGEDQYGNHGFVTLDMSKEDREAGKRSPILGNWKDLDRKKPAQDSHNQAKANAYQPQPEEDESDDIPF